jgi:prepilin-type N-terminal cleavage/methylation domain-containing protein
MTKRRREQGYTLIELLLVIVVLAILATVVVASMGGFTAEAEESACDGDAHILHTAVEAYFSQSRASMITPVGTTPDRFELRLVGEGFLGRPSGFYNLDVIGGLQQVPGSICTP